MESCGNIFHIVLFCAVKPPIGRSEGLSYLGEGRKDLIH